MLTGNVQLEEEGEVARPAVGAKAAKKARQRASKAAASKTAAEQAVPASKK